MNGTLALWYEGKTGSDRGDKPKKVQPPVVKLHVNLWRDIDKNFNFLDVGFLLEEVSDLERLYLYLPAPIDTGSVFDLSSALKDPDTLNAVFNEVASIDVEADSHFTINNGSSKFRTIHSVNPLRDLEVSPVNVVGRENGTIIALKTTLCDRITGCSHRDNEHYVRLRIFLRGRARNLFTTEDSSVGVGLSLTQDVLETTEFRLNERRSYPPMILQRTARGQVRLKSVHYFLIRSKNHQLGSQHQSFRKLRHLESDIWTSYLKIGQPSKRRAHTKRQADGMIIYQWREIAEGKKQLDDFIAYASFRVVKAKILPYLVAILAIGGVGSAIQAICLAVLPWVIEYVGWKAIGVGTANFYTAIFLSVLALSPMGWAIAKKCLASWQNHRKE